MAINTTHFELYKGQTGDTFNPLVQLNGNADKIDAAMWANKLQGVQRATELKSGTVHALTRTVPDAVMFAFTATSDYTAGDTFTVDGEQVTGVLPNGQALPTGAYLINSEVLCAKQGTKLTFFIGGGGAQPAPGEEFATKTYVDNAVAGVATQAAAAQQAAVASGQLATAAQGAADTAQQGVDELKSGLAQDITTIRVVNALPSNPDAQTLYLIRE